ncbi:MAG: ATP-dependent helicase RecG, partial [Candidatus Binataceae bacterium]|nr:ATP-dependent helicase RecG [Candidatus Binataceae bacterium]
MDNDARGAKPLQLTTPVASLPGIGPKRAAALEAGGLVTAGDLIFHLPARYQDWRERTSLEDLRPGVMAVIEGDLGKIVERPMRGSRWRTLASGWLDVGGRRIRVVWFNLPAYMRGYLPGGERVLVRGRVSATSDDGREDQIEIVQPEMHPLSQGDPKPIRPFYRLPAIVGQRLFASIVARVLAE